MIGGAFFAEVDAASGGGSGIDEKAPPIWANYSSESHCSDGSQQTKEENGRSDFA